MSDRSRAVALALGLVGLILGVISVSTDSGLVGLVAGIIAFGAGALAFVGRSSGGDESDGRVDGARRETERVKKDLQLAGERNEALQARVESLERENEAEEALTRPSLLGVTGASIPDGVPSGDALIDPETDLFSEGYFRVALDARIAAARRRLRPVAVILIEATLHLGEANETDGEPTAIADAIRETLREADTASRMSDGRFALILEDTPENGAIWTVERLRSRLVESHPGHTVWAGVACYPAHAFDTAEIVSQATAALAQAREWRQDRIEVATAD